MCFLVCVSSVWPCTREASESHTSVCVSTRIFLVVVVTQTKMTSYIRIIKSRGKKEKHTALKKLVIVVSVKVTQGRKIMCQPLRPQSLTDTGVKLYTELTFNEFIHANQLTTAVCWILAIY